MKINNFVFLLYVFLLGSFCFAQENTQDNDRTIRDECLKKATVLGNQLIVELYGCDKNCLDDVHVIEHLMLGAARVACTTIVEHTMHKFAPQGVSGVIILQESHLAIHTWPEFGYCAIDIFTCGESANPFAAVEFLKNAFKATTTRVVEVERGLDTVLCPISHDL